MFGYQRRESDYDITWKLCRGTTAAAKVGTLTAAESQFLQLKQQEISRLEHHLC